MLDTIKTTKGISKAFAVHVFEESIFNGDNTKFDLSPYRYIRFYSVENDHLDYYRQEVFKLFNHPVSRLVYGLTLEYVWKLPCSEFRVLKSKVIEQQREWNESKPSPEESK